MVDAHATHSTGAHASAGAAAGPTAATGTTGSTGAMAGAPAGPSLPLTQPPMELEQDASGLWMYHRPAWVGNPEIIKNGVSPAITTREQAVKVINQLYPGSFPEEKAEESKQAGGKDESKPTKAA